MKRFRPVILICLILVSLLALLWIFKSTPDEPQLPVDSRIMVPELKRSEFQLGLFTLGGLGGVYGASGKKLYRIVDDGTRAELVYSFANTLTAIHEREDGLLLVATDDDHWDANKPCQIYRSLNGGQSFEWVKVIKGGSALSWSIDSDKAGRLYLAEYGPQQQGMSKTLWRSVDDADHWEMIYQAPDKDKTHLHRIAVDPYTDDLWLTVGDGKNRAMLRSMDHGENWTQVERLQATAVAFGPKAIYWGKDKKGKPGVLRYDRESQRFESYFNPQEWGNYGGSIYDMLRLDSGELIIPFMKYPKQSHAASVWRGQEGEWTQMLVLASEQGKGVGAATIAGPDKAGWIYFPAYQMKVEPAQK